MKMQPFFDLLEGGPWKRVDDIGALAKIAEQPSLQLPACYVLPDAEQAAPAPEGSYVLHQVIQSTVAIVLVTRPDGARQGVSAAEMEQMEEAALERLFGKQPEGWDSPLTIADIRTVDISAGLIARVIRMRGRRSRRVTIQP